MPPLSYRYHRQRGKYPYLSIHALLMFNILIVNNFPSFIQKRTSSKVLSALSISWLTIIERSLSLRLIYHLLVFLYIKIKHSVRHIVPLGFCVRLLALLKVKHIKFPKKCVSLSPRNNKGQVFYGSPRKALPGRDWNRRKWFIYFWIQGFDRMEWRWTLVHA